MLGLVAALCLITGLQLAVDYREQQQRVHSELLEKSRVITEEMVATREFIARNQDRINYDSQGHFEFKALNPAAVGRGVGEIFNENTGYHIKQTRINPRNEKNAPDSFEAQVLLRFKNQPELTEYYTEDVVNGEPVFRYMIPLRVRESCLQCHGGSVGETDVAGYPKEGLHVGDLGGAISLTVPTKQFIADLKAEVIRHMWFFILLLTVILVVTYCLVRRLVTVPLGELQEAASRLGRGEMDIEGSRFKGYGEIRQLADQFQSMAGRLKELYGSLENRVDLRTAQLQDANRMLEEQRRELERSNLELSRASELKTQFLAGMSHEMRTPLTAIIAFSELALARIADNCAPEADNLREIKVNAERLLVLINDLLDLARIEAGRHELHLELVDLADLVASVESVLRPKIAEGQLDWEWRVAPGTPLIEVDGEKLRRAVLNLVSNAVKFTPPGGRVALQAGHDESADKVWIAVEDNGIGIRPEDKEMIFTRFYQTDGSAARRHGGSGLGLSLARELVEMHGGRVFVESTWGQGSRFTIRLPLKGGGGGAYNSAG